MSKNNNKQTDYYYILPFNNIYDQGLEIRFNNHSFNSRPSVSDIHAVKIHPFPYNFLSGLKLENKEQKSLGMHEVNLESKSYWRYKITNISNNVDTDKQYLVLLQSFNSGWKAYKIQKSKFKSHNWLICNFPYVFGQELQDHVLINNWANGWKIRQSQLKPDKSVKTSSNADFNRFQPISTDSNYIIIFWPQYLQYIGFALIVFAIVWIYFYKKPKNTKTHGYTKIKHVVSNKKPKQKANTELV